MSDLVSSLLNHGYFVLFVSILGRQACLPVPTNLLVLAAGALVGLGKLNPLGVLISALMAFLIADLAWYETGRIWGKRSLRLFCRAAHNPHLCVDNMVHAFNRHGVKALLLSKFIFGLDSIASPLSGATRIKRSSFLICDGLGALLWVIAYMSVGYVFRHRLDHVVIYSKELGAIVAVIVAAVVLALTIQRVIHWVRFVREPQVAELPSE